MTPLGIEEGSWDWTRDQAGNVGGFYGVQMTPDDYGRLGDLMRRGGVWKGQRLLSREYMRTVGRAVEDERLLRLADLGERGGAVHRPDGRRTAGSRNSRDFPELPADFYNFSGLFGQRVTVFPTQDIVIVRTGQDPGLVPAGQASWENELYKRVLAAMTDQTYEPPGDAPRVNQRTSDEDVDYGFGRPLLRARPVLEGRQPGPAAAGRPGARPRGDLRRAARRTRAGAASCA